MRAGRKRLLAALMTAALATCTVSPAKSDAASLPPGFFGVVPLLERPTLADLQQMAGNGVESMRLNFGWGFIESQPGKREWSDYDALIGDMAKAGITPSPLLFGVPSWINPHEAHPPIYTPAERSAWSTFLTDLAARYGTNGSFWSLHPELPYAPLTEWEIWNEPNLNGFWDGKPNPRRYLQLVELSRDALRRADPSAVVILGGLFPHPRRQFGISLTTFLTRLYRVPGARGLFDAVALHPYASEPRGVLEACLELRRLMAKHRDRRTALWITEVGWTTGGADFKRSPYRASEGGQARRLTRSFRLLIKSRGRLRLERIFWHGWRDYDGPGLDPWTAKMGLLRSDGSAKPSLSAFARLTGG